MKTLPTAPALLAPLLLATGAATAQGGAPLTMECHPLFRGVPMDTPTTYMLIGSDLFSKSEIGTTRISTAGRPLSLGSSRDKGVVTRTWAGHTRNGRIVTRRVYWQEGAKPRRVRFTERYDFLGKTITSSGERGDTCHANGR